jgi:hypothetical protein
LELVVKSGFTGLFAIKRIVAVILDWPGFGGNVLFRGSLFEGLACLPFRGRIPEVLGIFIGELKPLHFLGSRSDGHNQMPNLWWGRGRKVCEKVLVGESRGLANKINKQTGNSNVGPTLVLKGSPETNRRMGRKGLVGRTHGNSAMNPK